MVSETYTAWMTLGGLIVVSGFFSGSETALMRLNRYRLRHQAAKGHGSAKLLDRLLQRTDRTLGVVLIGNTLANVLASSVVTVLAVKLFGEAHIASAALALTLVLLIFAEVMPKTLAALYPEKIAYPVSWVLQVLLWVFYPIVWLINGFSNGLLACCRVPTRHRTVDPLSRDELRTLVHDTMDGQTSDHLRMLLRVLDLEKTTVNDLMVPRHAIEGLDLSLPWDAIRQHIEDSTHAWMPVYRDSFDNVQGILHLREAYKALLDGALHKGNLMQLVEDAYFVPELTPLSVQLLHFRARQRRVAIVVDEYGDALGLLTLEDLLEEIVGEFAEDACDMSTMAIEQEDGSYLIDGRAPVRELNRALQWHLPETGPKTLSGLVLEELAHIPQTAVSLAIGAYRVEIVAVQGQRVRQCRVWSVEAPA